MTTAHKILIVEDDTALNRLLTDQIGRVGYETRGAVRRAEAADLVREFSPHLIIMDVRLPDCKGFDLLEEFLQHGPVIVLTAYGSVDQAVKAVRAGASDYLIKPVNFENLGLAIRRVFATRELKRDVRFWRSQAAGEARGPVIGEGPETRAMRALIDLYAPADSTVLIEGESGVGKEQTGRAIHDASARSAARFVPVDCDRSEETRIASDLFGHEKGAFPGAETRHEGLLEIAEKGSVYISDIAEASLALQSKLLRVMETGLFRRIGGTQDIPVDVRIIAATSQDLGALVERGAFRSELFYRLEAFRTEVPPLRRRRNDIVVLAKHFLQARAFRRGIEKELTEEALALMRAYDWPGNVRELRNAVERGLIMSGSERLIQPQHLALDVRPHALDHSGPDGISLGFEEPPTLERLRDAYLALLLERYHGNRQKVARALGISERNTYRLIKRLGEG